MKNIILNRISEHRTCTMVKPEGKSVEPFLKCSARERSNQSYCVASRNTLAIKSVLCQETEEHKNISCTEQRLPSTEHIETSPNSILI
jgi:hypothetical protein